MISVLFPDQVTCILGEWKDSTAAGSDAPGKYANPKYEITVPKKGTLYLSCSVRFHVI